MDEELINKAILQARKAQSWLAYRRAAREINSIFKAGKETPSIKVRLAFLGSFTIEPIVDYLIVEAADLGIEIDSYIAGYDQLNQEILNPASSLYKFLSDITFLLVEHSNKYGSAEIISLAKTFKNNCNSRLIICDFLTIPQWPFHIIEEEKTKAVCLANQHLRQAFVDDTQVQICDINTLAAYHGYRNALSPEMLYMAKIPFSESFMALLSKKIISHIRAEKNLIRKCLVLDCDNTLWGGIIGEDGIDGIHLGPDSPGREFVDFQQAILELYEQGIILAINSKNNYDDVIEVFQNHPHMLLQEKHFAGMQINWDAKSSNMYFLAEEINIGLDSFVFVDDNPAERAMMRQMLPQVCTIELPENPSLYSRYLRETNEFANVYLTKEDRKRGEIYAAQKQRKDLQTNTQTLEDFLKSLEMVVSIRTAKQADIKRLAQLTQRTNQFNLTTCRYSTQDIQFMANSNKNSVYALSIKDKFGDNGIVGLAIVVKETKTWQIDTFLMSCRVIGRGVEDALVDRILRDAIKEQVETVQAQYIQTAKNSLVADFWQNTGFGNIESSGNKSIWQRDTANYKSKTVEYFELRNE